MDRQSILVFSLVAVMAVVMGITLTLGPISTDRPTVPSTKEQVR